MPRQSADDRRSGVSVTPIARLKPPPDLDVCEREEFLNIVLSVRPDHFQVCDTPLVASYAKAIVLERTASSELRAAGFVDAATGRPSPWHLILTQASRSVTTLSRILRLNPQSRSPLVEKQQTENYYERMRLMEGSKTDAEDAQQN